MARTVISTQREWEQARGKFSRSSDYRAFSQDFEFNPSSTVHLTGIPISEALPRAKPGGPRWTIFETAIVHGASVERVNEVAARISRQAHGRVEPDADIFIALFTGYARIEG